MAFERIVRPYQSPQVSPPAHEFAAGLAETDAPIRLRIGLVGKTRTFTLTNSLRTTAYVIRKPTEKEEE